MVKPYLFTIGAVLLIALLKGFINSTFDIESPLLLFFTAVTFSAWYGGARQGVLATVLSLLIVRFQFEYPSLGTPVSWGARYILFTADCFILSFICGRLRSSRNILRKREGQLRKIFESNIVGLVFSDFSGRLLAVNDYFLNLLGITRQEFLKTPLYWQDITPKEFLEQSRKASLDIQTHGRFEPFEKAYIKKDGSHVPVLIGGTKVTKNSQVSVILDLTEIKKTQHELAQVKVHLEERVEKRTRELRDAAEQLRQSRSFLDSIIENIPNMIFVKDAKDLRFVRFNRAGEKLLGRSRRDLVGKNDYDFFPKEEADFFTNKDRAVLEGGHALDIPEEPVTLPDGKTRYLHTRKIPILGKDGKAEFLLGISEDITERKYMETQRLELIQAQAARSAAEKHAEKMAYLMEAANEASRAKSAFLANISHEIRTPLGAMIGFTELALEDKKIPPEHLQHLKTVDRNGRLLLQLVDEILDLSKVESKHINIENVSFDLLQLLDELSDLFRVKASEKSLELKFAVSGEQSKLIVSDPTRLRQIMINVVGNAIKFTDRGSVDVRVHILEDQENPGKGWITFDVYDTGIGINPREVEHLFQPFVQADDSMTRRFGGTGLGLFLARKLAQLMGGDVSLEWSEPGRGSHFKVFIEVEFKEKRQKQKAAAEVSRPGSLKGLGEDRRVLIVDDAADNRVLLETLLQRRGLKTVSRENGLEGVETALKENFDVVLMDVQMPVMDGFEAVRKLRQHNYHRPIIALTAHAMSGDRERCLQAGFDDYVRKPINLKVLEESLIRHMASGT